MANIYKCDRCGKVFERSYGCKLDGNTTLSDISIRYIRPYANLYDHTDHGMYRHKFDFCDECLGEIIKFALPNGFKLSDTDNMLEYTEQYE